MECKDGQCDIRKFFKVHKNNGKGKPVCKAKRFQCLETDEKGWVVTCKKCLK